MTMTLGSTPEARERFILLSMIALGTGILAADIILPLGFVIWILYLIPLLMSVWLPNRFAPFITAWLITLSMLLGSLFSLSARAAPSDLPNRAVFILVIAVVTLLVWEIRNSYAALDNEVRERRAVQENLEVLTQSLEARVTARTRELSEANEALVDDIARRRIAEASLAAANRKLNLLSEITRHDISNRIFSLLVDIDLARDSAHDLRMKRALDKMEQTSMAIVDQITFTKDYQEIGAKAPAWYPVRNLIRLAADQLDLHGVTIAIRTGDTEILADGMIRKVFYNLIDNALRHGCSLSRIQFSVQETPGGLVIACEDDGGGVPTGEKTRIFSRGVGRGSGLGLFLISEILSITGITIQETGEFGKGARFELLVPPGDYRGSPGSAGNEEIIQERRKNGPTGNCVPSQIPVQPGQRL